VTPTEEHLSRAPEHVQLPVHLQPSFSLPPTTFGAFLELPALVYLFQLSPNQRKFNFLSSQFFIVPLLQAMVEPLISKKKLSG